MPALLRRRADLNDRIGLELAYRLAPGPEALPTVWASRQGQVSRSELLLTQLAKGEALSPMDFSLSVHNATAGLYSIAKADRAPNASLAAGPEGLLAALLEAQGMILEGAPRVLLLDHDHQPPQDYAGRWDPEAGYYGLGLLLDARQGQALVVRQHSSDGPDSELPLAVCLIKLLALGRGRSVWRRQGRCLELAL